MEKLILREGRKYTFSDYFEFNNPTEDIAHEFGYLFDTKILDLPCGTSMDQKEILRLQEIFYEVLPKISLNSEMAKKDFMIAPVLWGVIRHVDAKVHVEYPIKVDDQLGGFLDYLIRSEQELIVVEAKKGDLDKGFNQLTAEMIALDQYEEQRNRPEMIYGAVSIGELWRFAVLERKAKHLYRDLHTYRIPEDIEKIFSIIIGILEN